ncbi:hypothetical protein I3500192B8_20380 [Acidaminococcus intestini]
MDSIAARPGTYDYRSAEDKQASIETRFVKLKEKRIDGLANHAKCPIDTG